jgi:hypothetical protein
MERKPRTEGEGSMYKRILRKRIVKGLVISLALFAVIPISNAAAKPVSVGQPDPWFQTMLANQRYQQNQIGVSGPELAAMNARGEFLNKRYGLGRYAAEPTNTGSEIPWSDAGIGVGIAALLVAGTAGALVVRSRQHRGLAH